MVSDNFQNINMNSGQNRNGINTALVKPVASAAGIIGLIQGIFWTVFAILCICCYYGAIEISCSSTECTEYYEYMYIIFLKTSTSDSTSTLLVTPYELIVFVWFYLVFSVVWTLVSGSIIWAMIHNKLHLGKTLFGAWSLITGLTTVVDIVLVGLLAKDYTAIDGVFSQIVVTYGIMMSLAARGYVLLITNVIFTIVTAKFAVDVIRKENSGSNMPIIHGYETGDNPPWFDNSVKDFWASPQRPSFTPKVDNVYDNHGFERSQSFYPIQSNENPYSTLPSTTPTKPAEITSFSEAIANRTATIGKSRANRSPLTIVRAPMIPDPDYTPPSSPNGLKSVLRSKSNYSRAPAF